jgi:Predicted flavoproteins
MPLPLVKQFKNYLLSICKGISTDNNDMVASNIASALKSWKFKIVSNVGYERAVVTAGGVSLSDISQKTMESKIISGLYFAGEVLDIDGDTGGYNLQVAFSTGALAAISAVKSLT